MGYIVMKVKTRIEDLVSEYFLIKKRNKCTGISGLVKPISDIVNFKQSLERGWAKTKFRKIYQEIVDGD